MSKEKEEDKPWTVIAQCALRIEHTAVKLDRAKRRVDTLEAALDRERRGLHAAVEALVNSLKQPPAPGES